MITPQQPPAPVWFDNNSGLSIWVNGGLIEVAGPEFSRLLPEDAAGLPASFTAGMVEAIAWAQRWNTDIGDYDSAPR